MPLLNTNADSGAASKLGTVTNTGGTATIGAVLGDVANSSVAARLTALAAYVDTLETSIGTLTNSGGGTATLGGILGDVANSSVATRLGVLQSNLGASYNNSRYLAVTADMTDAAWNTVASQEVFTVTGLCRLRMWITSTGDVDSTAHGATLCFGHELDTDAFIADTDETELDTGDLWYDATPTLACDTFDNVVMDYVSNGLDIGYEIKGEALTTGSLVFHCVWEPLNATGAVVAGAGGAL